MTQTVTIEQSPRSTALDLEKPAVLVGCGAVAIDFHFPLLQAMVRRPQLYMVEVDDYRFRYLEKRWSTNPRVTVLREIPEDLEFSVALLATPPKFHRLYFEQLAGRSGHVLIEKPLAISAEDGRAIVELAEKTRTPTSVNLIRRLLLAFRMMRQLISDGDFGALRSVRVAEGGVFNWKAVSMGSFSRALNGGGALADTGPHTVDQLFQVFDAIEVEESYNDAWGGEDTVEANAVLRLRSDTGVPITLQLSRNRYLSNQAVFEFEGARCVVPVRENAIRVHREDGSSFQLFPPPGTELPPIPYPKFFDMFYQQFVVTGYTAPVSPREAQKSVELIETAYRTARPIRSPF